MFLAGCAAKAPEEIDTAMSAREGRELTVLMRGCDGKLTKGYHYCSLPEGALPVREISLIFPPSDCWRNSCIEFQFLRRDGSLGYGGSVPAGEVEVRIPLSKIVGYELPLAKRHEGEFRVLANYWYRDREGLEKRAEIQGIVRLWIHEAGYTRLICGDPETGWELPVDNGCRAHFSTGGRTAFCGKGCLIDGRPTK